MAAFALRGAGERDDGRAGINFLPDGARAYRAWRKPGKPGKRKRHPAFRLLFGNTLVLDTLRLQRLGAQRAFLVLFVFGKVTFEEFHLTFILIIQNVGGDTVKEPTVVRDNHRAARELQQGVFQRAEFRYPGRWSVRRAAGRCRPPATV